MNLLPEELRKAEEQELKRPVPRIPGPGYSAPTSQFEERLRQVSEPPFSFWQRLKNWFVTTPPPGGERVAVPPPPPAPKRTVSGPPHLMARGPLPPAAAPKGAAPKVPTFPTAAPQPPAQPKVPAVPKAQPPPIPLGVLLDVNLLPGEVRAAVGGERPGLGLAIISGAALLIIGIAYAVLSSLVVNRATHLESVEQRVEEFRRTVTSFEDQISQAELAGRKMEGLEKVLAARPDWVKFLNQLEALTMRTTNFTAMSVAASGELTIGAEAPSITDLARQLLVFERASEVINHVTMGAIALTDQTVDQPSVARTTFQLDLIPGWLASAPTQTEVKP